MSTSALDSEGFTLKIGDGASPEVFTAIPEITDLNGPSGSASVKDATDLNSSAKEKKMGLPDEGQITFTINHLPANTQHALLKTNRDARTLTNFQLLFTDSPATQWDFAAYITGFSLSDSIDGLHQANVTLEITGAITEV